MRAVLFFRMLASGQIVERRRNYRHYYEMCRVTAFPGMDETHRKETLSHYWDDSLSPIEKSRRDEIYAKVREDAAKTWAPSKAALSFFRRGPG